MPVIYCNISLFDTDQIIYLVEDEGSQKEIAKVPLDHLENTLSALCYSKNIYTIYLSGLSSFVKNVPQKIYAAERKMYTQNKIKVEVIKNEIFN